MTFRPIKLKKLLFCLFTPLILGVLSFLTAPGLKDVYLALNKPPLSPPPLLFSIVWPILYLMIGVSWYLIADSDSRRKKDALFPFYIQLALTFLWIPLFFGLKLFWAALAELILLWGFTVITMVKFKRIEELAGTLLLPYIVWMSYAIYLNLGVCLLN